VSTASNAVMSTNANATDGTFSSNMGWWGGGAVTSTIGALHVSKSGSVFTAYHAVGTSTVTATAGTAVAGANIPVGTLVSSGNVAFTFNAGEAYTTSVSAGIWRVKAAGTSFYVGALSGLTSGASVLVPNEGATLSYQGTAPSGHYFLATVDVTPGSTTVTLPSTKLTVTEPAGGTTGVSKTPTFTWNAVPGADSYLISLSGGSRLYTFVVPGNRTSFTVPDYTSIGAALQGSTAYHVSMMAFDGEGLDVNAFGTGHGYMHSHYVKSNWRMFTSGPATSFTTAP